MEKFFTSTRRYQDLVEYDRDVDDGPFEYTEVELTIPVEEFLVHFMDWKGLWDFLTGGVPRILWITQNAFLVVKENGNVFHFHDDAPGRFIEANFRGTSGQEQTLILTSDNRSIGEADVFWRAISTSKSIQVKIQDYQYEYSPVGLPSGPLLSEFLRENLSLQHLEFNSFLFNEEHCRALATLQRTDLKIKFKKCNLDPQGAEDTFIEWFRHNEVVTELNCCYVDSSILCALSGNNYVKTLTLRRYSRDYVNEEEIRSLAQALPGNVGIEHLTLVVEAPSRRDFVLSRRQFGLAAPTTAWCVKDRKDESDCPNALSQYSDTYNRFGRQFQRRGNVSELHHSPTRNESQLF
jgi:hypothetical protein